MTANSPALSTVSRFGNQQNPPVPVRSRTPYFIEKTTNNSELGMWTSVTAASPGNFRLLLWEITFFSCWSTPVAYRWHESASVWFSKSTTKERAEVHKGLHMASSLTPSGSSTLRALKHLDTSLYNPLAISCGITKAKNNTKINRVVFLFKIPLSAQVFHRVAQEQTSFTVQKRHINPTERRQPFESDTKSGNKITQPPSLVFAMPTALVQICV